MKKLLFLIPFIAFLLPVTAQAACGSGYSFCQTMTVQASKVPSTQTNFTVLATTTQAVLKTVANGGHVQNTTTFNGQTAPADLIFSSAADCSAPMSWDIEDYVASTGELEAWVLNSSLSSSVNTVFYMCYGKSSVTTYQGGSVGAAWNTNYKAVYHLGQNPTGSAPQLTDSTSNGINMTVQTGSQGSQANPSTVTGQIGNAVYFPTNNNQYNGTYAESSANSGAGTGTSLTTSAWLNFHSFLVPDLGSNINIFDIRFHFGIASSYNTSGYPVCAMLGNSKSTFVAPVSFSFTAGTWYNIVCTLSGSTVDLYINGVLNNTASTGGGTFPNDSSTQINGGDRYVDVQADEAHLAATAESADWITTEFNNQSNVPTFLNIGPEQAAGGGATPLTPFFTLLSGRIIILNGSFIIQ